MEQGPPALTLTPYKQQGAHSQLLPWLLHVFRRRGRCSSSEWRRSASTASGASSRWSSLGALATSAATSTGTIRVPHQETRMRTQHAERALSFVATRCRHLVETGQVVDPNYVIDEKGKAHYLFSKGICKHTKSHKRKDPGTWTALRVGSLKWWTDFNLAAVNTLDDAPQVKVKQQGKKRKGRTQKKKKGKEEDEDAHEEDDDEYVPPSSLKKQKGDGTTHHTSPLSLSLFWLHSTVR